jgi:glycosyltransferase involved in cell wall biosynthesis
MAKWHDGRELRRLPNEHRPRERAKAVRIGLDALLLGGKPGVRKTGVSRYEAQLTAALLNLPGEDDYRVYASPGNDEIEAPPATIWRAPRIPTAHPVARIGWEQSGLVFQAYRDRIDLLHGMAFVTPPAWRGPSVVTIHDLAFMKMGGHAPKRRSIYLSTMLRQSVKRADRVIVISSQTSRDAQELLGVDPDKIAITPLGVSPSLRPLTPAARAAFRLQNNLDRPTILYLGTLEPRKNVPILLRAFDRIAEESGAELVLGGAEGWLTDALHQTLTATRWRDRVRLTGFIPEADLASWLSAADCFAFPSRYEGFGLPPLEAMACGTPVVSSTSSSLPEVLGDDALLVDPDDVEGLGDALARVLGNAALAADLRKRGLARAARYSWTETARLTRIVYQEVLD